MKLGNGHSNFWLHPWLITRPLCQEVDFVDIHDMEVRVCDVWTGEAWDLPRLYTPIPHDLLPFINDIKPLLVSDIPDLWIWQHSYSGQYTTKTAYKCLLTRHDFPTVDGNWSWLWKLQLPANIQFFMWQVCHGAIPTRGLLFHRGIANHACCPRCNGHDETPIHFLFGCSQAMCLWRNLVLT